MRRPMASSKAGGFKLVEYRYRRNTLSRLSGGFVVSASSVAAGALSAEEIA